MSANIYPWQKSRRAIGLAERLPRGLLRLPLGCRIGARDRLTRAPRCSGLLVVAGCRQTAGIHLPSLAQALVRVSRIWEGD
eukprot:scaffold184460_cov30-Tisochrysis_lutea.AAC.5